MITTDMQIKALKPSAKPFRKGCGRGLNILVHPNGKKYWIYRYKFNNKENKTPGFLVSDDKTTITVTRTNPNDGFAFGSWTLTKEDPKGPVTIEIIFNDEVVQTFNYVIE